MSYQQFLEQPKISTAYQLNADTPMSKRLEMAQCFLSNKEYHFEITRNISLFNDVEDVLKAKVLAYAIAFANGATNGGMLYQYARADLLTWWAIFEGARFENGWLGI
ncbi:hypothetical protein KNV09_gp103 [Vibrio phage Athena]|uniref:Uncharacterized protein n=4 Tax=Thalassavirus TaxID=2948922 RepID=A0A6M4ESG0_9CAUD|nr:hypothetical protein KNU87_gp005 [Vibrio phage Bennett]YP_010105778.1 hypothetical protein KNU87_gp101 [Vibrio phage Bennett]YP_010105793.1 hypothetical protein KNU88_gp007 [Vibrio phage Chester]YP_010105969.1 hypothetical protein KNU88_gp103 [Vibrio phage Chester]YP_010108631.1 hypothetical protein KNV09_gp006 [Vibrio phage Athena]YP_010108807.1 hypothetical protein KNV09_gp103 [Vibrio phage Athena]YP_010114177.1 hypothetical protein KNV71_gp007 [Vibrio phage Gary]YP_010114361.1 hypothet